MSPPAGDQKNSIIQWLSRSNTDHHPTANTSSRKPHSLLILEFNFNFNLTFYLILFICLVTRSPQNSFSRRSLIETVVRFGSSIACSHETIRLSFSRAAMPRRPIGVLPDGGAQPVLLQSRVPPDVLQILQQRTHQRLGESQ